MRVRGYFDDDSTFRRVHRERAVALSGSRALLMQAAHPLAVFGLLLWVLFTLADSALVVYRRYVHSLSRAEEAAFWDDYKVVGRLFGLEDADMPATLAPTT